MVPRGGKADYGALGATFTPSAMPDLAVTVPYLSSTGAGAGYSSDLVLASESAHLGLPREFADAVLAGVREQVSMGPSVGSGRLVFDRAAHGLVGSSRNHFHILARALVRLLSLPKEADSEAVAAEITEVLA